MLPFKNKKLHKLDGLTIKIIFQIQNQDFGAKKNSRLKIPTKSKALSSNF